MDNYYLIIIIVALLIIFICFILFRKLRFFPKMTIKAARAKKAFRKENVTQIIHDLPRHGTFQYVNQGSLTEEFFTQAKASLVDEFIYFVFSNTGSAPSEIISVFTNKDYNHVSLSFDRDLQTLVSYNGGENIFPPGLNQEKLAYLNKKEDASLLIYKLEISAEKKARIIEKIRQINEEGSAYNLVGLVTNYSHKPNIMYCSQFVYEMLKTADALYFEKETSGVKPTDFIELDKNKKLIFVDEIKFNSN